MEYITTFNFSFYALLIYWVVTLLGEELFEFICILKGREQLYLLWSWDVFAWITKGWLLLLVVALAYSVKGTTTFYFWAIPGVAVSFLIHFLFEYADDWAAGRPLKGIFEDIVENLD